MLRFYAIDPGFGWGLSVICKKFSHFFEKVLDIRLLFVYLHTKTKNTTPYEHD